MLTLDLFFLLLLLLAPPWLIASCVERSSINRAFWQAILTILLPFSVAIVLHTAGIPICRQSLLLSHSILLLVGLLLSYRRLRPIPISAICPFGLLSVAVLLFPYTRLTGIDTYKWQDLATAIRMEAAIPWLIHPLGLFGFLPRSYPTLQPTLLASIQIMGNLGVEGGFRILSLLVLWVGFTTSRAWFGKRLAPEHAVLTAYAYILSPVFVRYAHWATGRGLFLALFPAFLLMLEDASGSIRRRVMQLSGMICMAFLLVLSHKTGWVAIGCILLSVSVAWLVPRKHLWRIACLLPVLTLSLVITNSALLGGIAGKLAGIPWFALTRFGILLPVAVFAWARKQTPTKGGLSSAAFLVTLTLAWDPQMYGALIALPFICLFGMAPIIDIVRITIEKRRYVLATGAVICLLVPAIGIVLARSAQAVSADVKQAALFLEKHDPTGPFQIHAPDGERPRIQAYLSGCPRFSFEGSPVLSRTFPPRPEWRTISRDGIFTWTAWLRGILGTDGLDVKWYGDIRTHYYFRVNGRGIIPAGGRILYRNNSVEIYVE